MMARTLSATPWGVEALPIEIEVDVRLGLPQIQIVGLADAAVRESRDRVRAAIRNSGFEMPPRSVVINLAPADLRKEGNHLDLAISLALLAAFGHLAEDQLNTRLFCGELGLDGAVRPIRGALALADLATRLGRRELVVPAESAPQGAALSVIPVVGVTSLRQAIDHVRGTHPLPPAVPPTNAPAGTEGGIDLRSVRGQGAAKRALEVAAAGGHNLLLIGPPGSGKTMLAQALPGILPPLSHAEALEVTKIHSLASEHPLTGLVQERTFRSPHPQTSAVALIGGGSIPQPGEVSLAHNGVLFLDELPEFPRAGLEALRQPLEDGVVTVVRARAKVRFPARFALLAAMNPCPCGHLGDRLHPCRCSAAAIERYRARISGPLLDRIDLHVEVPGLSLDELRGPTGEPSVRVRARVEQARQRQLERFGEGSPTPINAAMSSEEIERFCPLAPAARGLMDRAFERLGLSARALARVLKVARTIADLAASADIAPEHLAEAIQYRSLDRREHA